MNYEDQVAVLFAKANPVPSLDLLDPVEPVGMADLVEQSERSRVMIEVDTWEPTKHERHPKVGWLIGIAAAAVVGVVAGSLVDREPSPAAPEDVASAYIAAASAHDPEAARELLAPEFTDVFDEMSAWDHDRAVGWTFENRGCEVLGVDSGSTPVRCTTLVGTDVSRALGLDPAIGTYRVVVNDSGQITTAAWTMLDPGELQAAEDEFRSWLVENHPDDIVAMYDPVGDAYLTEDSVVLWDQYVDEYLASLEG